MSSAEARIDDGKHHPDTRKGKKRAGAVGHAREKGGAGCSRKTLTMAGVQIKRARRKMGKRKERKTNAGRPASPSTPATLATELRLNPSAAGE